MSLRKPSATLFAVLAIAAFAAVPQTASAAGDGFGLSAPHHVTSFVNEWGTAQYDINPVVVTNNTTHDATCSLNLSGGTTQNFNVWGGPLPLAPGQSWSGGIGTPPAGPKDIFWLTLTCSWSARNVVHTTLKTKKVIGDNQWVSSL